MLKTIALLTLSVFCLVACSKSQQVTESQFVSGKYNVEEKYWESSDPRYRTSSMSDPEYSQLSEYDKEGNSVGMGIVNKDGKIIVKPIYDEMFVGFVDGVCKVGIKNKWGLINQQGKEIVSPQYDSIQTKPAVDGLLEVRKGELMGYIDLSGKVIIPIQYASTEIAGEGMIAVMNEPQKWGYINYQNKIIIPFVFWSPAPFENGKAVKLQKDDGEYTVYKDGKIEQTKKW